MNFFSSSRQEEDHWRQTYTERIQADGLHQLPELKHLHDRRIHCMLIESKELWWPDGSRSSRTLISHSLQAMACVKLQFILVHTWNAEVGRLARERTREITAWFSFSFYRLLNNTINLPQTYWNSQQQIKFLSGMTSTWRASHTSCYALPFPHEILSLA